MKTLPLDYTFCTNIACPLFDCMRRHPPKTDKELSYCKFNYRAKLAVIESKNFMDIICDGYIKGETK